ncbi:aldehyde ferredoxin oxidoreductase, partial [Candidatus Bathyarchaeota archaeon]|nr:aldehyde ferredoxin oxidoreductase [Candidatus Bathyarchaeota archaeon]
MKKILRVDMSNLKAKEEKAPEEVKNMGGRWLTDHIVCDEVDPLCNPLGPNNKVVFAPGIVTGTDAPSSGRISVGGKSPLTGGIKEANAGTAFSQKIARLGYKAIVVEGLPKEKKLWLLKIDKDGAELLPADEWAGKGLHEVFPLLFNKFGE